MLQPTTVCARPRCGGLPRWGQRQRVTLWCEVGARLLVRLARVLTLNAARAPVWGECAAVTPQLTYASYVRRDMG